MSEQPLPGPLDAVSQKWRRLAERRLAHFIELFESGRWRHYYAEEEFLRRLRETIQACERWEAIAPPPVQEIKATAGDPGSTASDDPIADIPRRSAA